MGELIDVHFSSFRFSHPDIYVDLTSARINYPLLMTAVGTKPAPKYLKSTDSLWPLCGESGPIADIDQEQSNVRFGEKQTSAQKAFGN
jgi:hypothetical protein